MKNNTLTRAEASRINGAKSRGPKTEAGRQRSSMNALRHGFLAECVVLEGEDREVFDQVLAYHIEKFQPADDVEQDLIDEMVAAGWRMRRLWWIETKLFNEAQRNAPQTAEPLVDAFSRLAEGKQLDLLDRYESRLHKMYQRALKTLLQIRKSEELPPPPNEPEPEPTDQLPPLPNEPETGETASSADPLQPLPESVSSGQPNEPEQVDPSARYNQREVPAPVRSGSGIRLLSRSAG